MVAFFLCLAGAFLVPLLNGGVENTRGIFRYMYNIFGVLFIALFPFSLGSYGLTRSWREMRKNKDHRELLRRNPILAFLIWREVRDEEINDE
ncbi:hypothetical protein BMW22_26695 (plasmid) [Rhizobium leguminosarum]|uniref:Uncharacterized protein n=1 Tax=Rhizobium leguminosarum TaxID=384 RepID=A0A1L3ZK74_RHILE|nr:hypothetical protein BMW22_26695 [Rhizobium leguminosarum]